MMNLREMPVGGEALVFQASPGEGMKAVVLEMTGRWGHV